MRTPCDCTDPCSPTPAGPQGVGVATVKWFVVPNTGDNVGKDGVTVQMMTYYDDPTKDPSPGTPFFVPAMKGDKGDKGDKGLPGNNGNVVQVNTDSFFPTKTWRGEDIAVGDIILQADTRRTNNSVEQQISDVADEISSTQSEVSDLGTKITKTQTDLSGLTSQVVVLQALTSFVPLMKAANGDAYIPEQFKGKWAIYFITTDSPYTTDPTTTWVGNPTVGDLWLVNSALGHYSLLANNLVQNPNKALEDQVNDQKKQIDAQKTQIDDLTASLTALQNSFSETMKQIDLPVKSFVNGVSSTQEAIKDNLVDGTVEPDETDGGRKMVLEGKQ